MVTYTMGLLIYITVGQAKQADNVSVEYSYRSLLNIHAFKHADLIDWNNTCSFSYPSMVTRGKNVNHSRKLKMEGRMKKTQECKLGKKLKGKNEHKEESTAQNRYNDRRMSGLSVRTYLDILS